MSFRSFAAPILGLVLLAPGQAEPLRFIHHQGDLYRYYGSGTQRVTLDGRWLQDVDQSYKIAYKVAAVNDAGDGRLEGHISYLTARPGSSAALLDQEYDVSYWRTPRGIGTYDPGLVLPAVRNVPVLPEDETQVGDQWAFPGEEVHDLNDDFHIPQLLRVPFTATYSDEGTAEVEGQTVRVVRTDYKMYKRTGLGPAAGSLYPVLFAGQASQLHYFDPDRGLEVGYREDYDLQVTLNTGQVLAFSGTGGARLVEAQTMDKPALADEVRQALADQGLAQVKVHETPQGVTLNLDLIQFPGDSAQLLPSERAKLDAIAQVLAQYPDRDLLVEGHTADAASALDPQVLSERRAQAVGDALVAAGVRKPGQIVYKGWGAQRPLASNGTAEGRALNRRVEITLLEN